MSEPPEKAQQKVPTPLNFSVIVSGLFVVIIALLAVLWMRERAAGAKAQKDLAGMKQMCKDMALREMTMRMMMEGSAGRPFTRADLVATRDVRLDGKNRQALHITAEAGRRLGFRAGDVIVVSEAPPARTQPAGAASTPPRP